jgi:hypothetical protein
VANLPAEYNRPVLEDEIRKLNQRIDDMKTLLTFIPQASPVANPKIGMVMYSDGTTTDFSNHTERGLYRYDYVNPDVDGILGWMHFAMNDMQPFSITGTNGDVIDYTQSNDFVTLSNSNGGSWTLNLPSPVDQSFRTIRFISDDTTTGVSKIILDAGTFIIQPPGGIPAGSNTFDIARKYEGVTLYSDGTQWIVIQLSS